MDIINACGSRSILVHWIHLNNHFRSVNWYCQNLKAVIRPHPFNFSLRLLLFKPRDFLCAGLVDMILLGLYFFDSFVNFLLGFFSYVSDLLMLLFGFDSSHSWMRRLVLVCFLFCLRFFLLFFSVFFGFFRSIILSCIFDWFFLFGFLVFWNGIGVFLSWLLGLTFACLNNNFNLRLGLTFDWVFAILGITLNFLVTFETSRFEIVCAVIPNSNIEELGLVYGDQEWIMPFLFRVLFLIGEHTLELFDVRNMPVIVLMITKSVHFRQDLDPDWMIMYLQIFGFLVVTSCLMRQTGASKLDIFVWKSLQVEFWVLFFFLLSLFFFFLLFQVKPLFSLGFNSNFFFFGFHGLFSFMNFILHFFGITFISLNNDLAFKKFLIGISNCLWVDFGFFVLKEMFLLIDFFILLCYFFVFLFLYLFFYWLHNLFGLLDLILFLGKDLFLILNVRTFCHLLFGLFRFFILRLIRWFSRLLLRFASLGVFLFLFLFFVMVMPLIFFFFLFNLLFFFFLFFLFGFLLLNFFRLLFGFFFFFFWLFLRFFFFLLGRRFLSFFCLLLFLSFLLSLFFFQDFYSFLEGLSLGSGFLILFLVFGRRTSSLSFLGFLFLRLLFIILFLFIIFLLFSILFLFFGDFLGLFIFLFQLFVFWIVTRFLLLLGFLFGLFFLFLFFLVFLLLIFILFSTRFGLFLKLVF